MPTDAPDEAPLALIEKLRGTQRLAAVDRRGAALGLVRGLTLADARARIPDLVAVAADPAADGGFLAWLADLCDRFTPLVALDPPAGLLLDITGCAHLFGGEAGLRNRLRAGLGRLGLSVRAGLAATPDAARALARFGCGEATVPSLPVAALEADMATTQALTRAGLKTIGDLAERPSAALAARFGTGLTLRLDRILGCEDARIVPLRPPPACATERHFLEPLVQTQAVETVLAELVSEVVTLLEQRGAGGRAFEASLFRSDGQVRRILVETGRPSRDTAAILRLFALRVAALAEPIDAGFGIDALRLAVAVAEPLAVAQRDLDGSLAETTEVADLIDRLAARFGRDRVLRFVARDTHHPERAARRIPAQQPPGPSPPWPPAPPGPPTRPLTLFDPPQPIETMAEVPDGPPIRFRWRRALHDVARAEGPERVAPEWWREGPGAIARDYYRLEDSKGRRFWVFREGLHNEGTAPSWFLHGLFA